MAETKLVLFTVSFVANAKFLTNSSVVGGAD
jgi:hypothetical protein